MSIAWEEEVTELLGGSVMSAVRGRAEGTVMAIGHGD